jgi:hypothetical protein
MNIRKKREYKRTARASRCNKNGKQVFVNSPPPLCQERLIFASQALQAMNFRQCTVEIN